MRSRGKPEVLVHTLRTVQFIDTRIANPAYGGLLLTGFGLIYWGPRALTETWVISALVLYGLVFVLGVAVYAPLFRRQIAAAEGPGPDSPEYRRLDRASMALGIVMTVLVLGVVFLMVVKP